MTAGPIHIEGEITRITFESAESGFRVVKVAVDGQSDRVAVIGNFPRVAIGSRVRVSGTMVTDARHGPQLRAESVTELAPSTLLGVEKYLGSGSIAGIGEGFAKRIVAAFGLDTLRVLDEEPERLLEVDGLGKKRAEKVSQAWKEQRVVRDVMVFLQAHGASPSLAARIYRRYGARAVHVVSTDPYRLSLDVWGVGFKTADRIARGLGIDKDSPTRWQAAVLQSLQDASETGHTYETLHTLTESVAVLLGVDPMADGIPRRIELAADALAIEGHIALERVTANGLPGQGNALAFLSRLHLAEVRLSRRLVELATTRCRALEGADVAIRLFEQESCVKLAPEQKEAVKRAASSNVLVITGGPGVGKTTIVRAVVAVFGRQNLSVRLAAPTGRAAKRLSAATGREAVTLHRLLEFDPKTAAFKRDKEHPLDARVLIVDEASMIDTQMADALTQAVSPGTRLIFVGDVDQLPSVGPGAVLRDIIASRAVPCIRLLRIFRQAAESLIVTNAHRIHNGERPIVAMASGPAAAKTAVPRNEDFFLVERSDPESAKKTVVELVTSRIPKRFGLDPIRDIQVLTPMHRGPAGSIALNEALQTALNPTGDTFVHGNRRFRAGDKVMQLRNDYDKGIYNGDVGTVASIDSEEGALVVRYDAASEERSVTYTGPDLDDLTLSYASSVHKSQGSEYPAVVIVLLTSHFVMLSRNLLYTAVTRGKRLVVLVCDPRAITLSLAEDRKDERHTRLATRLQKGLREGMRGGHAEGVREGVTGTTR